MTERKLRLFFALWPDSATREAIAALAQQVATEAGGRAVAPQNAHLTLAFLGDQPARLVAKLQTRAEVIASRAFAIDFDTIGSWRNSGIAWLGVSATPPQLADLQRQLVDDLAKLGLKGDERPFAAHVTLARRITHSVSPRTIPQIVWSIDSFVLVASETGPRGPVYRELASWPLGAL